LLRRIHNQILAQGRANNRADAYRNLIRREATLGGTLFGPVPSGHRRDFFCLNPNTWVWHEEWVDSVGENKSRTTHYTVRPSGIVKRQDGQTYQSLSPSELGNLRDAVRMYYKRVMTEIYRQPV
jgi:hypothetical protein